MIPCILSIGKQNIVVKRCVCVVGHTCNFSTWKIKAEWSSWVQGQPMPESETSSQSQIKSDKQKPKPAHAVVHRVAVCMHKWTPPPLQWLFFFYWAWTDGHTRWKTETCLWYYSFNFALGSIFPPKEKYMCKGFCYNFDRANPTLLRGEALRAAVECVPAPGKFLCRFPCPGSVWHLHTWLRN